MKQQLKLYTENLLLRAPKIPDCSVDVIVTSPPYKRRDGYSHELMEALGEVAGRVLRPGGRFFMNFGQLREDFDRPGAAQGIVKEWSGLEVGQTIAWVKSLALPSWKSGALERVDRLLKLRTASDLAYRVKVAKDLKELQDYLRGEGEVLSRGHSTTITHKSPTLTYCWEPIFTYYKPPELQLNRLAIGCRYADKSNLRRGTRGKNGDIKCAGDTWWIPYETTGHTKKKATAGMRDAYAFPLGLPLRAIRLSSLAKGCVVFDPFMGSGTTAVAAKILGMHAWGIELDPAKAPVIRRRWEVGDEAVKDMDL